MGIAFVSDYEDIASLSEDHYALARKVDEINYQLDVLKKELVNIGRQVQKDRLRRMDYLKILIESYDLPNQGRESVTIYDFKAFTWAVYKTLEAQDEEE